MIRSTLLALPLLLAAIPASAARPQDDAERARREEAFAALLTDARLVGFTTIDGVLGVKEDTYTLRKVSKQPDGKWRFEAQIEFGGNAVPIAMGLPVEWAGSTPVITVDELAFPMMGTYSARVLFHGDRYAGVWTGDGYGGEMFGRVVRAGEEAPAAGGEDAGAEERQGDGGPGGSGSPGAGDAPEASGDATAAAPASREDGVHWPSFRGPGASGVADSHALPAEWDVESGGGILWSEEVPGLAHSSPVIWGDALYVTTAIRLDGEQELRVGLYGDIAPVQDTSEFAFEVYAYDKHTGEQLWSATPWAGVPAIKRHTKGSHAASTPAVDAERVLAFFGSEGLHCYDHAGELLWSKDFGVLDAGYFAVPDAQWGFASSPVLFEGKAIVQCDVQGQSFVAALDAATGEELWRTNREEVPTWGTPTVDVREGRRQVICNGWKHIGAYDLDTGAELWKLEGGGDIPVPTPIVTGDTILITNAHGSLAPILAISATAKGTLSMDAKPEQGLLWSHERRGNYMQTPLVYGEEAYFCNDAGILACYDVATGEEIYRERLGEGRTGFTGSGVAGDGKLYFTSEEGEVHVVRAGRDFELLATNPLGEEFMSSPAISEGTLFFRGRTRLVAVSAAAE